MAKVPGLAGDWNENTRVYTVGDGTTETLSNIAKVLLNGTEHAQWICSKNGIPYKNVSIILTHGMTLTIPNPDTEIEPSFLTLTAGVTPDIWYMGPAAGTDRSMVAQWNWKYTTTTDHYQVIWEYWLPVENSPKKGVWIIGSDTKTSDGTAKNCYSAYTVPSNGTKVKVSVLPVSMSYEKNEATATTTQEENKKLWEKVKDKAESVIANFIPKTVTTENKYWVANWGTHKEFIIGQDSPPAKPDVPSVSFSAQTMKLTFSYTNLASTITQVQFRLTIGGSSLAGRHTEYNWLNVVDGHAEYVVSIAAGKSYYASGRVRNSKTLASEWSDMSELIETPPAAPTAFANAVTVRIQSTLSAKLTWNPVNGATSYDVEYATDPNYFDGGGPTQIESTEYTQLTLTSIASGYHYYFRLRAVNDIGNSPWIPKNKYRDLIIGEKPEAPTTWSSTTKGIVGENVILYFTHNTKDGSYMEEGTIEWWVNGTKQPNIVIPKSADPVIYENNTKSYTLSTIGLSPASHIEWSAKTKGALNTYSDSSGKRTIDIYAQPTLDSAVLDASGTQISEIVQYPFNVYLEASPAEQTPITYHISIISNSSYDILDSSGRRTFINEGQEIYSRNFDSTDHDILVNFSPSDITLSKQASYTIRAMVAMNSGLSASSAPIDIDTNLGDVTFLPNATIGINRASLTASIAPYALDENDEYPPDVKLSVYRMEVDGKLTEIATDIDNNFGVYVTDPHPSFDYARYRIVGKDMVTGEVQYYDSVGVPVLEPGILIQWDEEYRDQVTTLDAQTDPTWAGDAVRILYNVSISDSNTVDVENVQYIGREHPVSYYGTQLGFVSTWQADIPKTDTETLSAIRRLAVWMGNAYVRESSGTGYWAHVKVSYTRSYNDLVIPVTFSITRVEGGM